MKKAVRMIVIFLAKFPDGFGFTSPDTEVDQLSKDMRARDRDYGFKASLQ